MYKMKAKHILTAIALPAMLAACSQDEDLSGALSQKDYSNIPTVSAAFTASVNEGNAQTRMETKFGWELGDKIGLAWLGDGSVVGNPIDGKAYQNHPLFCTDPVAKSFETKTMLYIGKYYAYLPYNENIKSVEVMKFNVTGQELATTTDPYGKKAIYISPKLTELVANPTEGQEGAGMGKNVKLNISQLSNAATVNLTFGNASKFTDLKVMGISLDAQKAGSTSVLPASFTYAPKESASVGEWSEMENSKIITGTAGNFFNTDGPATATPGAIAATSKEGLTVANNKLTTYILTLPATEAATALVVTVTTNYGNVEVDLDDVIGSTTDKAIILKDKGDKAEKTISNAKIFNNFGAAGSIDVYVDLSKLKVPEEVATQAELNAALNTLVTKGQTDPATITVKPAEANKANTAELTDFTFPEGLKCVVTLKADDTNASEGFVFKGNTVINSQMTLDSKASVDGTMTIQNIVVDKAQVTTLTTTASKPLTINAGAKLVNEGKIDNVISGSIVISAANGDEVPAAIFVSNTENATVTTDGAFTNNGEVQWIAGTLPTTKLTTGTVYAKATTLDQLLDAAAAFPAASNTSTNEVIIDGSLSIGGSHMSFSLANIKKLTIKGDVTLNMKATYTTTDLATINVESGSLNFTEGTNAFEPKAGCKLKLSKDTKLNVAEGATINLGASSSINYDGAAVSNNGTIKVGSTSGSGSWSGNAYTTPD